MIIDELAVLRWLHIIAMVYWLGGEWGVFQTSYNVINRALGLDERRRHMETAHRIDILARTGILLLFPLGFHMGVVWGIHDYDGWWLVGLWAAFAAWLSLTWSAFIHRETDRGLLLTRVDERLRYAFIPLLVAIALSSLLGYGPFRSADGQLWFSAKVLVYGMLLVIGLYLRFVMREWTELFRALAQNPDDAGAEATLDRSIRRARTIAYVYWVGIASVAFLGVAKPF